MSVMAPTAVPTGVSGVSQSDRGVRRGRVDVAVERLGHLASIGERAGTSYARRPRPHAIFLGVVNLSRKQAAAREQAATGHARPRVLSGMMPGSGG
jgi:hypothetical protein